MGFDWKVISSVFVRRGISRLSAASEERWYFILDVLDEYGLLLLRNFVTCDEDGRLRIAVGFDWKISSSVFCDEALHD